MLIKQSYSSNSTVQVLKHSDTESMLASPIISERIEKFAKQVQRIAPKSNDFLYFSIIFLKAAESALIDEFGELKKIGNEKAWGFFDDKWKWHGNVKAHKNSNSDIFPESELRKAAKDWIGKGLFVDHKSDSVDAMRGIILDTHYDEKLKQVVGLCALDKVAYPDLAHKVEKGIVRFGSMGTAVSHAICTECQKPAATQADYCECILSKRAYGEINIGLKPVEYSLVVQPAEPGAVLLRVFASIKNHEKELRSFGVDDLDHLTAKLSEDKANELDIILEKTCGENGCSLEQRQKIITSFLEQNHIVKNAKIKKSELDLSSVEKITQSLAELSGASQNLGVDKAKVSAVANRLIEELSGLSTPRDMSTPQGETLSSGQSAVGGPDSATIRVEDYQGTKGNGSESSGLLSSNSGELTDSFDTGGVGPESYLTRTANKNEITSIMEEIMKETNLRRRAENRRKIAYHFGGSDSGVEPNTYKSEDYKKYWETDKQMYPNPANLNGPDGMAPGDKEVKDRQKRAQEPTKTPANGEKDFPQSDWPWLHGSGQKKMAYHFGGSEGVEPSTYKSEDYKKYWETDKQMYPNPTNLGGTDGMVPGDKEVKEKQKRASYNGPKLSTKFKKKVNLDGTINKAASCFEVYAGNKLVIAATAKDIMGPELEKEWGWISSMDYAKAVVAAIRENGLEKVASALTKKAQQLPQLPAETQVAPPASTPATGGFEAPEMPEMEEGGTEEEADMGEGDPKSTVEQALTDVENSVDKIRSALEELGGGQDVDINVGVPPEGEEGQEKLSLSRQLLGDLKIALDEANESADELAKISETLDRAHVLPADLKRELRTIAASAVFDASKLLGETDTLVKMATRVARSMVKTSTYTEKATKQTRSKPANMVDNSLVKDALELRKNRREAMIKGAQGFDFVSRVDDEKEELDMNAEDEVCESEVDDSCDTTEMESDAHDGIGMKENARVSNVTTDTAESVANKQPKAPASQPAPAHKGNQDAKQYSEYPSTPAKELALKSMADDAELSEAVHDIAKEEADEDVEEHEESMHEKENSALDEIKAKLNVSLLQKKAEEERQAYRVKVRRAYNIAIDMQRKGMIPVTRASLDSQVDKLLEFDDNSFESFKRTIDGIKQVKNASDNSDGIGQLNIGLGEKEQATAPYDMAADLSRLWSNK